MTLPKAKNKKAQYWWLINNKFNMCTTALHICLDFLGTCWGVASLVSLAYSPQPGKVSGSLLKSSSFQVAREGSADVSQGRSQSLQVLLFHCSKREWAAQFKKLYKVEKTQQTCFLPVLSEFCKLQSNPFLSNHTKSLSAKCKNENTIGERSRSYPFPNPEESANTKYMVLPCIQRGMEW